MAACALPPTSVLTHSYMQAHIHASRRQRTAAPYLKKSRSERMWPRSTRNTPQICSRAHPRCGSSQRGVCRRPLLSGNRRLASELEGELEEEEVV